MDKIAVFGGTFNPFHNGHLQIIQSLIKLNAFKKIIVIPTNIPPHKTSSYLASGEDRLNMCKLALSSYTQVYISDIEILRDGPSYTYDTVCELMKTEGDKICLVCGGDMISTLDTWYNYQELIKLVDIVAFKRIGTDDEAFYRTIDKIRLAGGVVSILEDEIIDISSTEIRDNKDFNVPDVVREYIVQKRLYNVDNR